MNKKRDYITVVSGVPRSGTSMMMRMLQAGGLQLVVDDERQPDINNPYGYYEYEPVKQLARNSDWLVQAYGRAVKVIYLLLYKLPDNHPYRVIFMTRNLGEVVASQDVMLEGVHSIQSTTQHSQIVSSIKEQLVELDEWVRSKENFQILYVDYKHVIDSPLESAKLIAQFVGESVDVNSMKGVVQPSLYRQQSS